MAMKLIDGTIRMREEDIPADIDAKRVTDADLQPGERRPIVTKAKVVRTRRKGTNEGDAPEATEAPAADETTEA